MKRKDLYIILAGLAVGAGLGLILFFVVGYAGWGSRFEAPQAGRSLDFSPSVGNPAPEFELEDLSGQFVRLSDQEGRAVLINFWATWCGPCRLEMPALEERFQKYDSQLVVLAVNFDETPEVVQAFVDELGLTFPVLLDPGGKVQDLYRVRGYPTTYLVDPDGVVQVAHIGLMTEEQIDRYLAQVGVGE